MGSHAVDGGLIVVKDKDNDPEPTAPTPPEPGDCCGDGCSRCVNDVYAEALDRYEARLASRRE